MEETSLNPNTNENSNDTRNETANQKPYNLEPNIEAMLAYLPFISIFTSLGIFMMEKENKFVRFHALQGLLFSIVYIVLSMALTLTFVLAFLIPILNLAAFAVWSFMIYKSYNREEFELPILGKIARDQIK